jgi:predicted alpha/beta-fold hydrolase
LLKSGHFNTIYPYLFRKDPIIPYQRYRKDTPDGDFIDIDTLQNGFKKLAILCHGLEGNADSKYIKHTALILNENGWDVIAMNYRGCSGEMNRKLQMYHSGFTQDLGFLVDCYKDQYEKIAIIGFSLGGNILLKYLGEQGAKISSKIIAAVGISVPCDLSAGAKRIARWDNYFYQKKFLITLNLKIKQKKKLFPEKVNLDHFAKIKTLWDFDEYYTGPLHGFTGAEDYYKKSSCKQFLTNIRVPSLIINAKDDPFLPAESYPELEANNNDNLGLIMPNHGGHVGFTLKGSKYYWEEIMITKFLSDPSSILDNFI